MADPQTAITLPFDLPEPIARFILVSLFYTRTPATDFAMIASDLERMAQRTLEPGPARDARSAARRLRAVAAAEATLNG